MKTRVLDQTELILFFAFPLVVVQGISNISHYYSIFTSRLLGPILIPPAFVWGQLQECSSTKVGNTSAKYWFRMRQPPNHSLSIDQQNEITHGNNTKEGSKIIATTALFISPQGCPSLITTLQYLPLGQMSWMVFATVVKTLFIDISKHRPLALMSYNDKE